MTTRYRALLSLLLVLLLAATSFWLCTDKGASQAATLIRAAQIALSDVFAFTGNNTHSGTETFSNTFNSCRTNGTRLVDTLNTCGWSGADACAQAISAYNDLPASGTIQWAAGSYTCTTQMSFSTLNKYVVLRGDPSQGTTITYTAAASPFITFNDGRNGLPIGHGLRDIKIIVNNATPPNVLLVGGSNGAVGWYGSNYQIQGGNPNFQLGSNTQSIKSDHCIINEGLQGFLFPNTLTLAGEQIVFTDCIFAVTTPWTADYVRINPSAANNAQIYFNDVHMDNVQFHQSGGNVYISGLHQEPFQSPGAVYYDLIDGGVYTSKGNTIISNQAGVPTGFFSCISGASCSVGENNFQNTGASTIGFNVDAASTLNLGALEALTGTFNYLSAANGAHLGRFDALAWCLGTNASGLSCLSPAPNQVVAGVTSNMWGCQIPGVSNTCSWTTSGDLGLAGRLAAVGPVLEFGSVCTNGELALSAGWQSTGSATVTAVAGNGQTCSWTITTGTTTAANPTVTDTLTNALPAATTRCWMFLEYGPASTHTAAAGEGFAQTTLSATAPVFTFNGTPTAANKTYLVVRTCGP